MTLSAWSFSRSSQIEWGGARGAGIKSRQSLVAKLSKVLKGVPFLGSVTLANIHIFYLLEDQNVPKMKPDGSQLIDPR